MANNENDLSDNSGMPNGDALLKHMRIAISGPVGIGKTIIADRIERLLREEFHAEHVMVAAHITQERNAMNMADWRSCMSEQLAKTVYVIDEEIIDRSKIIIRADIAEPGGDETVMIQLNGDDKT